MAMLPGIMPQAVRPLTAFCQGGGGREGGCTVFLPQLPGLGSVFSFQA